MRSLVLLLLAALSPTDLHAQATASPHEMHQRHGDPAAYIASLEDPERDRFVIVDTWHHIGDQPSYLALLKRMLKPGGQVVQIDFQ